MGQYDHLTESQFQAMILEACKALGLAVYHTHDSRRSEPGFPDLVIVGRDQILYRELKTATGKTSPDQQYWLAILHGARANAAVWRPSDWPVAIMHELKTLGKLTLPRPAPRKRIPRQR